MLDVLKCLRTCELHIEHSTVRCCYISGTTLAPSRSKAHRGIAVYIHQNGVGRWDTCRWNIHEIIEPIAARIRSRYRHHKCMLSVGQSVDLTVHDPVLSCSEIIVGDYGTIDRTLTIGICTVDGRSENTNVCAYAK